MSLKPGGRGRGGKGKEKPQMDVPNQWEQQYPYSLHTTNRITGFNEHNCNLNFNINTRLIYYRNISNDTQLPIFPDEKKHSKQTLLVRFFSSFSSFFFKGSELKGDRVRSSNHTPFTYSHMTRPLHSSCARLSQKKIIKKYPLIIFLVSERFPN